MDKVKKMRTCLSDFREASILIIVILFCIVMTFLSPHFFTWDNLSTTVISMCCNGIIAIGMTIVLASGGIDLSVGSLLALAGALTGSMFIKGFNIYLSALTALGVCVLFGAVNGLIASKTTIAPMICTLGTMSMATGLALVVTQGSPQSIKDVPAAFRFIGKGNIGGMPVIILIFLTLAVLFSVLMKKSVLMRQVFYVGSNQQSAEFSGIPVMRTKMGVYILSAVLSGIAGIITTARFTVATPTAGTGSEMTAISAAVIGGASVSGGEGSIPGTILGLLLLTFINNALVLLKVDVYWQELISGGILLAAVLIDYFSHRRRG